MKKNNVIEQLVYVKIIESHALKSQLPPTTNISWIHYWVTHTPFMWDASNWFRCQACHHTLFKKYLVPALVEIVGEEGKRYIIPLCLTCAQKIGSDFKTNRVMLVEVGDVDA